MKNFTKVFATLMLMAAMLFTVGCKKDKVEESGGGGNNGGGNGTYNGYAYVDLGLPSGLLWATCNVGADNPEDYGDYFAWGETQPKGYYDWNTYRYCNGSYSYNTLTKYCNDPDCGYNGFSDNLTTLLPVDDAATANWGTGWHMPTKAEWGSDWRMPTKAEWEELLGNTTVTLVSQNGVNGCLLSASNGNSLFLPAAGDRSGSDLISAGSRGFYWSSSLATDYPKCALILYFDSGSYGMGNDYRCYGRSVRPVRSSGQNTSYSINAITYPTNGGTITGGGNFALGQSCTLTATANEGYAFVNWTENGEVVSTNAIYTFPVNANRTLVANFTTGGGGNGTYNGYAYVDLGLPSGLLWATCNVGATTPEGYGDYFAWGETQPKDTYNWSTYQYCNGSNNTLTKYCNDPDYGYNGFTDNLTTLLPEDDAATANWGDGWRMPTKEEWEELKNNTTVTWTTQNGVNGRLFTASNGNSLFLPAAGYRYISSLCHANYGYYWSSSLYTDGPYVAWILYFDSGGYSMYLSTRYCGQSVRPVRSGQN